jgi:hypothetical protein
LPSAVTILTALEPLAMVRVPIFPTVSAFPLHFTFIVFTVVSIAIAESFEAAPMSLVLVPHALVVPRVLVMADAATLPHLRVWVEFAHIHRILVLFYSEKLALLEV